MAKVKRKAGRPKKIKVEKTIVPDVVMDNTGDITNNMPVLCLSEEETKDVAVPGTKETIKATAQGHIVSDADYYDLQKLRGEENERRKAQELEKEDYKYYSNIDKGSSVPAWELKRNIEMLDEEVASMDRDFKSGAVPGDQVYAQQEEYKMKKDRLDTIKNSKPKLTGPQKDRLRGVVDDLGAKIKDAQFTQLEMEKGLADPHEEARRMTEPVIEVDETEARRMGIKTRNGKVTRTVAESMWKHGSSLLGETAANPSTETLRRTMGGGTNRSQVMLGNIPWLDKEKEKIKKETVGV